MSQAIRCLTVGDKVLVHSLKSRADLNGAPATLQEWVQEKQRWVLIVTDEPENGGPKKRSVRGERVLVRPENLCAMSVSHELLAAVHAAIDVADVDTVLSRFVEGVFWPQEVAMELMAAAWKTDERLGFVGAKMKHGGVVSALFVGMSECQVMLGIVQAEGMSELAFVDNAAMLLFTFAIDTDNIKALALVYEWNPDFLISRGPDETGIAHSAEAIGALNLGDNEDCGLVIDYAYELAERSGAAACFKYLCKCNDTAKKVDQARRAAQRDAGVAPIRAVSCAWCGTEADKSLMKRCQQCRVAWYCGRQCQRAAWPMHKASCVDAVAGEAVEAALVRVDTPWGTTRFTRVIKHTLTPNSSSANSTHGRPPPCSSDPTRRCFLLQPRVRTPGGGDWLSAPRDTSDVLYAVDVRSKVCIALEERGYRLLEACLLNAAYYDDGTRESRFLRVATECATALDAEVKLAALCVDPGLGLVIKEEDYADQAWEQMSGGADSPDPAGSAERVAAATERKTASKGVSMARRRGRSASELALLELAYLVVARPPAAWPWDTQTHGHCARCEV